jgi:hypothetical protein
MIVSLKRSGNLASCGDEHVRMQGQQERAPSGCLLAIQFAALESTVLTGMGMCVKIEQHRQ